MFFHSLPHVARRRRRPRGGTAPLALCAALLAACGGGHHHAQDDALQSVAGYERSRSLGGVGQALLLQYRMPAVRGGQTLARALLFVPRGTPPAAGWPLVVWAHGTTGIADACAPSRDYDNYEDKGVVQALLDAGFAVLAPDYEGLGAPGPHPYLSLASQGRSITVAVQAAHEISSVRLTRSWSVIGHSQGGYAALAAAQFAGEIASDYPLRATVAMSPATDLGWSAEELFARIDELQARFDSQPSEALAARLVQAAWTTAYNGALVAWGLQAQDPALVPGRVLTASFLPLAELAPADADCTAFPTALQADLVRHIAAQGKVADYPAVRRDLRAQPGVDAALARNRPAQLRLDTPVYYLQGALDDQAPVGAARRTVDAMKSVGTVVNYVEVADGTHESVIASHLPEAIRFLRSRLAP